MKHKILIVDDDVGFANFTKDIIVKNLDVKTDVRYDSETAIAKLKRISYDIILLDIVMPENSGYAVADFVSKNNIKSIIIFISAEVFIEEKLKAYNYGATDFLAKPFSEKELIAKLRAYLTLLDRFQK